MRFRRSLFSAKQAFVLLSLGALFLVAGSLLFPSFSESFINGGSASIGVLVLVTVAVAIGVHKRFGRSEQTPELAQPYLSVRQQRWAIYLYWALGIGWLVVAILTLAHKRH
jgi:hypothetical protein